MQALPPALFIVMLELTVGSFISLYFLDLRGDSSRGFVKFQGILYLVFGVLTLLAMNNFATPEIVRGDGLDEAWLGWQGPLVLVFTLLMIPWNVLLFTDKQQELKKTAIAKGQRLPVTPRARVRFAVGAVTSLVGLAALFAVGMAYRTLASAHLGGAFVVLAFLAGGIALGGVMTAMLLGHWYLNTPTASGKPLEFVTALLLGAVLVELACTLLMGASTARPNPYAQTVTPGTTIQVQNGKYVVVTPTPLPTTTATQGQPGQRGQPALQDVRQTPIGTDVMHWMLILMGLLAPAVLGGVALYLARGRSFQSATGMLYLAVAFIFIGEALGRYLLLSPVFS
ncbi:MAG TPA: hypothetical protein VFA70_05425 [Dehalococcoidia bacterium]|nr:hypothetical protein [Dehalococcoidia bacterium]